jgi:hypothetical protein
MMNGKYIRVLNSGPQYEDRWEGGGVTPRVLNLENRCWSGGSRVIAFLCMTQNRWVLDGALRKKKKKKKEEVIFRPIPGPESWKFDLRGFVKS